ncbi:Putative snRNP Sm-like protein [Candidatus Tiddalikarchaeum anstoanum]|nr:Putative snRNP Sm-like protein [Candidatus Tiddalikarchaeum anstoanum]
MELTKPLDALNQARDQRILVELKNGSQFVGKLKAFDVHLNTVLDDAQEIVDGEAKRNLGRILLRGDTIILLSPQKGQ